jgi:hypothetical protein
MICPDCKTGGHGMEIEGCSCPCHKSLDETKPLHAPTSVMFDETFCGRWILENESRAIVLYFRLDSNQYQGVIINGCNGYVTTWNENGNHITTPKFNLKERVRPTGELEKERKT